MRTQKQIEATNTNWSKVRILGAISACAFAIDHAKISYDTRQELCSAHRKLKDVIRAWKF